MLQLKLLSFPGNGVKKISVAENGDNDQFRKTNTGCDIGELFNRVAKICRHGCGLSICY